MAPGPAMHGKYMPLYEYLLRRDGDHWRASFRELERVLDAPLPHSASTYQAWWDNTRQHRQARAWLSAGWEAQDLDIHARRVTFVRIPRHDR